MQSEIINSILQLFDFILVFCIVIILLGLILSASFKKENIQNKNIQLYGMFLGLENRSILGLALATLRYLFIIWCTIGAKEMIYIFLVFLLIICMIYHIIYLSVIELILDGFNCMIIYASLLISNILNNYVIELNNNTSLLMISYLLKILVLIYSTYFFFKSINEILKNNKKGE